MKTKHFLTTSCLLILGSATSSFAAYTLANGDFASNNTTGWTPSGSVDASTGAAVVGTGGSIQQDFSSGTTATTENYNFQLDFSFSFSTLANTNRVRLRSNNYVGGPDAPEGDLITLRINSGNIENFNNVGWVTALTTPTTITTGTNYFLRVIGSGINASPGRSYTVGFSTDGINYTTSSAINTFHTNPDQIKDFESIGFEGGPSSSFTIDNVSVIPEPGAALLGGLGALALLRRRRA